jgi:hypothetical protein
MMNVASRKKMMSMSGMISIRARLPAPRGTVHGHSFTVWGW